MKTTLIYGPPGTGKTYTLQKSVEEFGKPTLCVSFTRAAAKELTKRGVGATASTLHSLAYRSLDMGSYAVIDRDKLNDLTKVCGIPFRGGDFDDFTTAGDEYLSLMALARNTYKDPESLSALVTLGTASEFLWFLDTYKKWKKSNYFVDFTDMIMAAQNPKRDVDLSGNWAGMVVDEAQDLTPAQWGLVNRVISQNNFERLWVAGDDDQAIYSWAGASPSGMRDFGTMYDAEDVVLSQSFRVPSLVHRVAEGLIQRIKSRKTKEYAPRREEGKVNHVFTLHNAHEYDAILYRNHSIGVELARDLSHIGVPYVGRNVRSPMASRHAKLAIAYNHVISGIQVPGRIKTDIQQKVFGGDIRKHMENQTHWTKALPLPVDVRQKLMIIESRFGPIHKVKPVILSTIHQYKGKEEDKILLIDGMNERTNTGTVNDPDSEIRVFYVGITRAKKELGIMEQTNPIGLRRLVNV